MYKLIVSDLDETLLNDDKIVSSKNRQAIQKARELGVKFVPATGRGYKSIQGTLKELGLDGLEDEYVISFNSGAITENKDNKLLEYNALDFDTVDQLFKKSLEYDNLCSHIYTKDKVYVYNLTDNEKDYLNGRMVVEEFFEPSIDFLKDDKIVKILYVDTDFDYLESIADSIEPKLKDNLDISYSAGRYLEFNKKGVNKGAGLESLAKRLGIDINDTIAIGDNYNDLTMIEKAGLGVGVKNSADIIKEKADYITQATNNEDAVSEIINKFILDKV